ncbi:MAG: exocyst complex component exo84 [Caeruleum heppii]|nr:MAG: exocyst complex component exo84 [Caeruleum heppii]
MRGQTPEDPLYQGLFRQGIGPLQSHLVVTHQWTDRKQGLLQEERRTSDYVKRRYSTRPGALPQNFLDAPPVPSVPSLPGHRGPDGTTHREGAHSRGDGVAVDLKALRDPDLRAQEYVTSLLTSASEQEIRDYQQQLQKTRNRTSTDLQQNVYENRTQFINISREAEKLKGEMRTLRALMSELKGNTDALTQNSTRSADVLTDTYASNYEPRTSNARKHANRSSVANLEAMWNTQLQALWKDVEGSQKYLPAVPGRHVLRDSPHWVELNSATWKSGRAMHMFLLNDHLLIASKKIKRIEQPQGMDGPDQKRQPPLSKLVAERCWPLLDVQLEELPSSFSIAGLSASKKERQNVSSALSIQVGNDSFTYCNRDAREKDGFLRAARKAREELRKSDRLHKDESRSPEETSHSSSGKSLGANGALESSQTVARSVSIRPSEVLIDVEGKQQNLQWVQNQIDELDIDIALQRFDEAVSRFERLTRLARTLKTNAKVQELILSKVQTRAGLLAGLITDQLVLTHSFTNATKRNVGWLVRLNFEDRARASYLDARSCLIERRSRQCLFEGNLPDYIYQVSFVYFTIIRNTISIYQTCFPPLMMSGCVKWAKEHVDGFNEILRRQLSGFERDSEMWRECIDVATGQAQLMTEVGLDFKTLVGVENQDRSSSVALQTKGPVGLGLG